MIATYKNTMYILYGKKKSRVANNIEQSSPIYKYKQNLNIIE